MEIYPNQQRFSKKFVSDYGKLGKLVEGLKSVDLVVVMTIGSWDGLHVGHTRYLEEAKARGDCLIVGVDTDRAIELYKEPGRPLVAEEFRIEMLANLECVDYITLVGDVDDQGNWQYGLVKATRPNIFIVQGYPPEQVAQLQTYCDQVIELPRQELAFSTTRMFRKAGQAYLAKILRAAQEEDSGD